MLFISILCKLSTHLTHIVKLCGDEVLDQALELIEPLCLDPDRFKQRAGVEILLGLTRGAKHWPQTKQVKLSQWVMARIPKFFNLIKPDTRNLWESYFCVSSSNILLIKFLTVLLYALSCN